MSRDLIGDDGGFRLAGFARCDHRRRTVRVGATEIRDLMPTQPLEAYPDVGLHMLDEVPYVDVAIHIGQGRGHKQAPTTHRTRILAAKVWAASVPTFRSGEGLLRKTV
jgi:hypothetical protein